MVSLPDVQSFLNSENGLATVSTIQIDGGILSSVVNCGVVTHPRTKDLCVAFVSVGEAARLKHIQRGSKVTISIRRGWKWVSVTGNAALFGPENISNSLSAESLRLLLRDVFVAAGGKHDNFEEYDQVMASEKRVVLCIEIERILGNSN